MVAGLAALAILIPLMIPLLSLTLGQQDTAALSTSTTARQAYDLISQNFGAGVNGPLLVAVRLGSPAQPASGSSSQSQGQSSSSSSGSSSGSGSGSSSSSSANSDPRTTDPRLATLQKDVSGTSGVQAVTPIQIDKAGTTAYFNAISTQGPADKKTTALVNTLRNDVIPKAEKGTNMKADVGGTTAGYDDLASRISSKLPLQILVVIALSFVLLILAFRTVVIPPQAAVMNLLSIGASYGVLTAIFQYGWLSDVIGLTGPVPIVSYVPLFMFAILFGLSMDYEVFLVSQIEEHVHAGRGQPQLGRLRAGHERARDHRRGADHGVRVRQLRAQRRPDDQAVRDRPGGRGDPRRDGRALPARAGADDADGQGQLVHAAVA